MILFALQCLWHYAFVPFVIMACRPTLAITSLYSPEGSDGAVGTHLYGDSTTVYERTLLHYTRYIMTVVGTPRGRTFLVPHAPRAAGPVYDAVITATPCLDTLPLRTHTTHAALPPAARHYIWLAKLRWNLLAHAHSPHLLETFPRLQIYLTFWKVDSTTPLYALPATTTIQISLHLPAVQHMAHTHGTLRGRRDL